MTHHKKADDEKGAEAPKETPTDSFVAAVSAVSDAAKKFTDAGMGGPEAWKTALELWRDTHGTQPAKG